MISIFICLSACSSYNNQNSLSKFGANSKQTAVKISQNNSKKASNIKIVQDLNAKNVIVRFYNLLNNKKYSSASALLGPQLKFEGTPKFAKYLKNIKNTKIIKLVDISKNPGPINPNYNKYYKVKIYYGEINIKVQDPNLVPNLRGVNYRKFILIKKNKKSSWLIDLKQGTNKR